MTSALTCNPGLATGLRTRSARLAERLEVGARALADFVQPLSDAEWARPTPGDGRSVGVIVHHVATIYPLEVQLAKLIAAGTPVVDVTWATIHEMNAAHAVEHAAVTKEETLALLAANSAAAAATIRTFSDQDLDRATCVSLYGNVELTSQFLLEDHAVRHSYHHLARLREALRQLTSA
jgi:hypothetical protein